MDFIFEFYGFIMGFVFVENLTTPSEFKIVKPSGPILTVRKGIISLLFASIGTVVWVALPLDSAILRVISDIGLLLMIKFMAKEKLTNVVVLMLISFAAIMPVSLTVGFTLEALGINHRSVMPLLTHTILILIFRKFSFNKLYAFFCESTKVHECNSRISRNLRSGTVSHASTFLW